MRLSPYTSLLGDYFNAKFENYIFYYRNYYCLNNTKKLVS